MHRLNELAMKLTPGQVKEVEDFAEFLLTRDAHQSPTQQAREEYLNVDAFAGMLAGMAPEKSAVELVHEANASLAAKYDGRVK